MTQPLNAAFFASVRASLFEGGLTQGQVDALNAINRAWEKYGDGDVRKKSYVFATAYHEVGADLSPKSENMNYRAARIREVWPSRFKSVAAAQEYASNPQKLANKVYGGRLGNVNPDDGWRFRGRGYSQITGRENYTRFGKLLGVSLVNNPDLAMDPGYAAAILVIGVVQGLFTGRKLADGVPDWVAARATVNADGRTNGTRIGRYASKFEAAFIVAAREPVHPKPLPPKVEAPKAEPATPAPTPSFVAAIIAILKAIFTRK